MAKFNISQILAMESINTVDDKAFKKLTLRQKKNYSIAHEGLFDFFRKKKGEEVKKKPEDPKEHLAELEQASKVSIHLMTTSVDTEIKFLEELISKGLPLFSKDYDRMVRSFKFVVDNHKDILSKVDKLVDVSFPGSDYKLAKEMAAVEFNTFYVALRDMAKDKEHQVMIGHGWDYYDVEDEFDQELSDEQIDEYTKLYCINEAVPSLDFVIPKNRSTKEQARAYLEKDDPKLQKLLKLNMELIEKGSKVITEADREKLFELANKADKLTHPKSIGDGDEYGLANIMYQSLGYQYELSTGFAKDFIKNYTAH